MRNSLKFAVIVVLCLTGAYSCKKLNSPVEPNMVLTPQAKNVKASQDVPIDMTIAAASNIKTLRITVKYASNPEQVLKDSTLNPTKGYLDEVFLYHVPDTAIKGQVSTIKVTVTDEKGNSYSSSVDITVAASIPAIKATPNKTTAAAGDSVVFALKMSSPLPNLVTLNVTQTLVAGKEDQVYTQSFPSLKTIDKSYTYHMPADRKSGDHVIVGFTVIDDAGGKKSAATQIDVP